MLRLLLPMPPSQPFLLLRRQPHPTAAIARGCLLASSASAIHDPILDITRPSAPAELPAQRPFASHDPCPGQVAGSLFLCCLCLCLVFVFVIVAFHASHCVFQFCLLLLLANCFLCVCVFALPLLCFSSFPLLRLSASLFSSAAFALFRCCFCLLPCVCLSLSAYSWFLFFCFSAFLLLLLFRFLDREMRARI